MAVAVECPIRGGDSAARELVSSRKRGGAMLWTLAVLLLVLWVVGLLTAHTMGGLLHILLVLALVVLVIRLVQSRRGV